MAEQGANQQLPINEVAELHDQVVGLPPSLVLFSDGRKLLRRGRLQKAVKAKRSVSGLKAHLSGKTRIVLLLSDLVVYCETPSMSDAKRRMKFKGMFNLSDIEVRRDAHTSTVFHLTIMSGGDSRKSYVMTADSGDERDAWVESIANAQIRSAADVSATRARKGSVCFNEDNGHSPAPDQPAVSGGAAVALSRSLLEEVITLCQQQLPFILMNMEEALDMLRSHRSFTSFAERTKQLSFVDVPSLSRDERIVFFLNVYHTLAIHSVFYYHRRLREHLVIATKAGGATKTRQSRSPSTPIAASASLAPPQGGHRLSSSSSPSSTNASCSSSSSGSHKSMKDFLRPLAAHTRAVASPRFSRRDKEERSSEEEEHELEISALFNWKASVCYDIGSRARAASSSASPSLSTSNSGGRRNAVRISKDTLRRGSFSGIGASDATSDKSQLFCYSLHVLEHTIFRGGASGSTDVIVDEESGALIPHLYSPCMPRDPLDRSDPRVAAAVPTRSPLVLLCLNCFTKSSPCLQVFVHPEEKALREQLEQVARSYMRSHIRIYNHSNRKLVRLPRMMQWMASDFGRNESDLLGMIRDYVADDAALGLSAVISSPDPWELLYGEYDSSFAFAIAHTPEEADLHCRILPRGGVCQWYAFSVDRGRLVHVEERLMESRWPFEVAYHLLPHFIESMEQFAGEHAFDERETEENRRAISHFSSMQRVYRNYDGAFNGLTFRPSTYKETAVLQAVALNLHLQRMCVATSEVIDPGSPDQDSFYTVTFGAPAAHFLKFEQGGLRSLDKALREMRLQPGQESERSRVRIEWNLMQRRAACVPQALSALVTVFAASLQNPRMRMDRFLQYSEIGYLVHFESLLSTAGGELGMLEDMDYAVSYLQNIRVRLRKHSDAELQYGVGDEGPEMTVIQRISVEKGRDHGTAKVPAELFVLTLSIRSDVWETLPSALHGGKFISIVPVLFTQGINEQQSVANQLSKHVKLQKNINVESIGNLMTYATAFKQRNFAIAGPCYTTQQLSRDVSELLDAVRNESRRDKNTEVLMLAADLTRRMNAGRCISCKSAKDRTSMAVTLEQARILGHWYGMGEEEQRVATRSMRTHGVRLENCFKNIGRMNYAFNSVQRTLIPKPYRAPKGTYGNAET